MKCKYTSFLIVSIFFTLVNVSNVSAQNKLVLRLDQIMTPEDQKRTGITKLTKSEREALEQWLTNWTLMVLEKASASSQQKYTNLGSGHWISENIDGGRLIKLEDGSL